MKRSLPMLLALLMMVGCSKSNFSSNLERVDIYKMISFSETVDDSLLTFTDEEDIKVFTQAFDKAKKQPGIVDIADPEYKVVLGNKTYYLWLPDEEEGSTYGTIMDDADTHYIYSLSEKATEKIKALLS